jgi:O-antigen ligase
MIGLLLTVFLALFLTDSRGSMLALGLAFVFIAALRYRKLLVIMMIAGLIALFLPFTQRYIDKFEAGFTGEDVETQMRLGEYKDAFILIGRYPVIGVGFTGTPEIDLYLSFASTYLMIAGQAGIIGLIAYLLLFISALGYSATHYRAIQSDPALSDIWLGLAAGLIGVLVGGIFDHFYFNVEQFHATTTAVMILLGLMLAATRLAALKE